MKLFNIITISTLLLLGLFSCTNEDLNPLPEIETRVGLVSGEVVLPTGGAINLNTDDVIIDILVESPQGSVDSFTLMGKISDGDFPDAFPDFGDFVVLKTITEFPAHITVTATELTAAFGFVPSDFTGADLEYFKFMGTSVSNGVTVNLDAVTGAGFSSADNPDGIASGLTNLYQESTTNYVLHY